MTYKLTIAAAVALVAATTTMSDTADAHRHHDRREYRGHSNYDRKCGSGNGAVGTVAGGVGGALLGNAVGGGTLGTIGGGVGGALLGRTLDKNHTRSRNRC